MIQYYMMLRYAIEQVMNVILMTILGFPNRPV